MCSTPQRQQGGSNTNYQFRQNIQAKLPELRQMIQAAKSNFRQRIQAKGLPEKNRNQVTTIRSQNEITEIRSQILDLRN